MVSADTGAAVSDVADDNDKSCFICLQTAAETPDAAWVTPCPCSLDAHEACMLQWIAETEVSGAGSGGGGGRQNGQKKLRCPACNARIRTVEPHDPLVALGDRAALMYRRASPMLLGSMLMAMGVAGSSFYGFQSMGSFAGEAETMDWLMAGMAAVAGEGQGGSRGRPSAAVRWRENLVLINKVVLLNLLAPGLLLQRALPSLANLIALPASLIYGASLVSRNHLPRWPPSPAWVLAAMPTISIAYATAYYDLFGGLERRLNRALRGRPEEEPPQELRAPEAVPPVGAGENNNNNNNNNAQDAQNAQLPQGHGVLAGLRRIGQAMTHLLGNEDGNEVDMVLENAAAAAAFANNNQDMAIQVEIVVEEVEGPLHVRGDHGGDDNDDNDNDGDWVDEVDDDEILPPRVVRDDDMNILGGVGVGAVHGDGADDDDDAALPPPDILRARRDDDGPVGVDMMGMDAADVLDALPLAEALAAQVADANGPVPLVAPAPAPPANIGGGGGGGGMLFSDVIATITTQLLLPRLAATVGIVLGHVLPRAWVVPPPPESRVRVDLWTVRGPVPRRGLLMEHWGRSLVGGLLWIVLRDAWSLYIKYRRVQVKRQRKIKNVERRRSPRGEADTST